MHAALFQDNLKCKGKYKGFIPLPVFYIFKDKNQAVLRGSPSDFETVMKKTSVEGSVGGLSDRYAVRWGGKAGPSVCLLGP